MVMNATGAVIPMDPPHRFNAVQAVQVDVHKDQVKPVRLTSRKKILSGFKGADIGRSAVGCDQSAEVLEVSPVVFADRYVELFHTQTPRFFF